MNFKKLILAIALVSMAIGVQAQTVGKTARYCNPLPMVVGDGGQASGDVSVFQWEGKYYMFCTGGGCWVSEDMLNWDYHYVANVPVAPDVVPYNINARYYINTSSRDMAASIQPLAKKFSASRLTANRSADLFLKFKPILLWES